MAKQNTTKLTIALFWQHANKYPKYLYPLLIIVPINILLADFLAPYITSQVLNKISSGQFDASNLWASFGPQITLFAVILFLSGVVGWRLIIWLIWRLEMRVLRDMSQTVFDHLLKMSAHFHANRFGGSLVSQANKLAGSYVRFADATIFNMYTLLIATIAAMAILAPRVPIYAAALLTLMVLYILGTLKLSGPVRDANTREAEAQSRQTGSLADAVTNIMAVKSFAGGSLERKRYWKVATKTLKATERSMFTTTKRETYASIITTTVSVAALVIAIIGVGKYGIDLGTAFLMVIYTNTINGRLWEFQNVLRQYNRAMGDASDMVKVLQIQPGIKDAENPEPSRITQGQIEFKHVVFAHADAHKHDVLFNDLNLHIRPGEKVGLVGHSGSGKTTLTRILLRFSDIDGGEINIDGQNIASISQDDLRRNISYVPQEPLLFHRSIRENIAYGRPNATKEEIIEATRKAHAHDFIEKMPEGYNTLVGERGVKLSGGQRQRIAIARAILKDAPILVLDEATSALDSESEHLIQAALQELMKKRTAIVIAHRLSTVQKMDRIVVMDHGKIVEEGSHAELIAKQGIYASLWAHQSGGFIDD